MTVELRPLYEACNLACTYCYQEASRTSGNMPHKYDLQLMLDEVDKVGQEFSLFGGEALLVPKKDLEFLFAHGLNKYGKNSIQTNGTLIDDDHIAMFVKYKVSVGISIDGPADLNNLRKIRGKNSDEETLKSTETIMNNIMKVRQAGINLSVIITLHRLNGNLEALPRLLNFMRWLGNIGVTSGNLHTLEVDPTMPDQEIYVLSQKENAEAFLIIAKFLKQNPDLGWSPFLDMKRMLVADDAGTNCTWHFCDPMNTQAVYGIEGNGSLSNCGRTNKEGIGWYKANDNQYSRYIGFYSTPDEQGGCQGCRFWMSCGGSCPGESIDGDFRNKTIHCHTQKTLLTHFETELLEEGIAPLSLSPIRGAIEKIMLTDMHLGNRPSISSALAQIKSQQVRVLEIPSIKE